MGIIKNKIPPNVLVFIEDKSYELFELIIKTSVVFLEYLSQERSDFIRNFPRFKYEMIKEQNKLSSLGINSEIIDEDESTMFLDDQELLEQPHESSTSQKYHAQVDNGLMRNYHISPNKSIKALSYIAFLQHIDIAKIKWIIDVVLDLKQVFDYQPISIMNLSHDMIKNEVEDMLSTEFKRRYLYFISVVTKKQKDAKYSELLKREESKIPIEYPNRLQKIAEIKHDLQRKKREELQQIEKEFISEESCDYIINFLNHFAGYLLQNTSDKQLFPNLHFFTIDILQNECGIIQKYLSGNAQRYTKEIILSSKINSYFPDKELLFTKIVNKAINLVKWSFETKLRVSDTEIELIQKYLSNHNVWIQDPTKRNIKLDMLTLFNTLQKGDITVEQLLKKYFEIVLLLSNRYSFSQYAKNLFLRSNRTFGETVANKSLFYILPELILLTNEDQSKLMISLETNVTTIINDIFEDKSSSLSEFIISNENAILLKNICSNKITNDPAFYYKDGENIVCVSQSEIEDILTEQSKVSNIPKTIKDAIVKLFNKHSPYDFDIKLEDINSSINNQLTRELLILLIPEIEQLKERKKYIRFNELSAKSLLKKIVLNTPATKDELDITLHHLLTVCIHKISQIKKEIISKYLTDNPEVREDLKQYVLVYNQDVLYSKITTLLSGGLKNKSLWEILSGYTFTTQSSTTKNEIIKYILEIENLIQRPVEVIQQCDLCKTRTNDLSFIIKNNELKHVCVNCIPDEATLDDIEQVQPREKLSKDNRIDIIKQIWNILGTWNLNDVIKNYPIGIINKCKDLIQKLDFDVNSVTWNNIVGTRAMLQNLQLNQEFMKLWNTITHVSKKTQKQSSIIQDLKSYIQKNIDTNDIGAVMKKWFIENKKGDVDYSLISYQNYLNMIKTLIKLSLEVYNKNGEITEETWNLEYTRKYDSYASEYERNIENFLIQIKQPYLNSETINTKILNFSQVLNVSENHIKSLIDNKITSKDLIKLILINNYIYPPDEVQEWFLNSLKELYSIIYTNQSIIISEVQEYTKKNKRLNLTKIKEILQKSSNFKPSLFYNGIYELKNKCGLHSLVNAIKISQKTVNIILKDILDNSLKIKIDSEKQYSDSLHPVYIDILRDFQSSKTSNEFIEKLLDIKINLSQNMINIVSSNFTPDIVIETLFESHHDIYKKAIKVYKDFNSQDFEDFIKTSITDSILIYPKSDNFDILLLLLNQYTSSRTDPVITEYINNLSNCAIGLYLKDIYVIQKLLNTDFSVLNTDHEATLVSERSNIDSLILDYCKIIPPKIESFNDLSKAFDSSYKQYILKNYTRETSILRICENIYNNKIKINKLITLDLDHILNYGLNYNHFFDIYTEYVKNVENAISIFLKQYVVIYAKNLENKQFTPPDEFLKRGISEYAGPAESATIMKKNWNAYQKQQQQNILSGVLKSLKIKYNYTHIYKDENERKIFEQLLKKTIIDNDDYTDEQVEEHNEIEGDGDYDGEIDY